MSDTPEEKKDDEKVEPPPDERAVLTEHEVTIGNELVAYTATAGTLHLRDEKGKPRASVFYVAYTKDGADPGTRPITFAFNGGPGSSAVWLHLGILGPRRADVPDGAVAPPPPYRLVNNESSILDHSDLVFVDPVGTGYSVPLGKSELKDFHTIDKDVKSVAEFVRRYLTRHSRWSAPRFLAGESYGTTRCAALASELWSEGIALNGLVLVSLALDFQTFVFRHGNDLPHALYLPTYAATAAYHGVLSEPPEDEEAFLREAREFALNRYLPALAHGAALADADREAVAVELARFTGLDAKWIVDHDLRIDYGRFRKQLLRERGVSVGRMDSRFVGHEGTEHDAMPAHDPAMYGPWGPYTSLINDYLRTELGFEEEREYAVLSFDVNQSWNWYDEKAPLGYVNVVSSLRRVMLQNPHMKVLFMNGIYDLATPFFASEYTVRHLGREQHVRENITETFYPAGHMMYVHEKSRKQMRRDLLLFLKGAVPTR